ncbi:MAG TPA: glycosyltransferase family 2 protein [Pirellulales bacterium]|nr:glycosyltransferase family 2 protein [Pirellulales bacterium]
MQTIVPEADMPLGEHYDAAAMPTRPAADDTLVSVVLPVFNEVEVLKSLLGQVRMALASCRVRSEIVFVDDGSSDGSSRLLDQLAARYSDVRVIHFSRNFGHQAAVQAGLRHARGHAVVLMDSDLQDAPSAIGQFLERWREGYDIVYAVRVRRKERAWKRALFGAFHRLMSSVATTPIPAEAGNFSLIDARAVRQIVTLAERDRYLPGLRSWVGFRQCGIEVERNARYDARPRVSLRGLMRLAKTAIFSFSALPLTVFYLIACAAMAVFLGLGTFSLYCRLFTGLAIPGWTSYILSASFFGALNALGISMLGEYVVRIYDQVRARPFYLIDRTVNFAPQTRRADDGPTATDAADPHEQLLAETEELLELVDQSRPPERSPEIELRTHAEALSSVNRV